MTWARTRTRANNNVIHVKQQESMGIGANAAARIDREHSLNHAAIDKASADLRLEVAIREKRWKELEFLEKGGDPLDFEYGDGAEVILSESEAKERKLFVLQNKNLSNGIVAGIRNSIKGQVSGADSQARRFARNGDSCEQSKQVLRRGTLPSIVRVKEEKCAQASNTESKPENGDSTVDGKTATNIAENGPTEKAVEEISLHAKNATEQPERVLAVQKEDAAENKEVDANGEVKDNKSAPAAECSVASHVHEEKSDKLAVPEKAARNEDDILQAAKAIQAARECASRKPLCEPSRRKSHWDYVLQEMAWMANDFMQERLWKLSAAAHVCRSASQASFWAKAEKKAAEAANANVKESAVTAEESSDKIKSERTAPLEKFAYTFLTSTSEPPSFSVPCTPEVEERVLSKKLHFIIPHGASEAFKRSVERSWSSKMAGENDSEPDEDSFFQGNLLTAKREFDGLESGLKKKRRLETDADVLEDEFSEFFDVPVKRQRTSGVAGRPRSDKKTKKGGKPNRLRFMNKGTDSENEWVPEAVPVEKFEKTLKRKKDHLMPFRAKDELATSKKARLSRLGESTERLKKSSLRKGTDFLHVSINQPGNGVPWSSLEDQAIIVLEHDLGPNWELLSDILNAGSHLKGHFRTPKDCKDRHLLLLENMPPGSEGFPGVSKGTGMMMLQKMQGPMEADTVKYHFEQIIQVKKRHSELLKDFPHDVEQKAHQSFEEVQKTHGQNPSPLHYADQPVIQKTEQVSLVKVTPTAEPKPSLARHNTEENSRDGEPQVPPKPVRKVAQKTSLEDKDKAVVQQATTVKQEPVHRAAPDNKADQLHRLQQLHKQRNWEQKDLPMQPHPRMAGPSAMLVSGGNSNACRPSFQQKKSSPLPPCSTSQQHQEPPSFADHHQHPQMQPAFRLPQQNSMAMQQQQPQQQNFHYNHRCFSGPGPRYSPAAQWRPGQNTPGMFNQMNCMGTPGTAADAAAFQQARFQSPGLNPRSMKQQPQMPRTAVQQQQQQAAHHYLPSSVAGAVRYTYSGAQPGYHHPVYNNGKTWQQQTQGNGGAVAPAERSCLPPTTDSTGGGLDAAPSSSCK